MESHTLIALELALVVLVIAGLGIRELWSLRRPPADRDDASRDRPGSASGRVRD